MHDGIASRYVTALMNPRFDENSVTGQVSHLSVEEPEKRRAP